MLFCPLQELTWQKWFSTLSWLIRAGLITAEGNCANLMATKDWIPRHMDCNQTKVWLTQNGCCFLVFPFSSQSWIDESGSVFLIGDLIGMISLVCHWTIQLVLMYESTELLSHQAGSYLFLLLSSALDISKKWYKKDNENLLQHFDLQAPENFRLSSEVLNNDVSKLVYVLFLIIW